MSGDDRIQVEGVVVEVLPGNRFRVELSNGHVVMGLVSVRNRQFSGEIRIGSAVSMQMSAYDFSKGRICFNEK